FRLELLDFVYSGKYGRTYSHWRICPILVARDTLVGVESVLFRRHQCLKSYLSESIWRDGILVLHHKSYCYNRDDCFRCLPPHLRCRRRSSNGEEFSK